MFGPDCASMSTSFITIRMTLGGRIRWEAKRTHILKFDWNSTWISCYVIHCKTPATCAEFCLRAKAESPTERHRKPRNVNACAHGISLTRPSRVAASANASEARKSAMYTDTHRYAWRDSARSRRDPRARTCLTPGPDHVYRTDTEVPRRSQRMQYALPTRLYATLMQFSEPSSYEYVKDVVLWLRVKWP